MLPKKFSSKFPPKQSKQEISQSFSPDLVIRNLIFTALYVIGILWFFSSYILPTMKSFKSQYIIERKERLIYEEIARGYSAAKQRLDDFANLNTNALSKLKSADPQAETKALVAKFLTIKEMRRVSQSEIPNEGTRSITFAFKTQTKSVDNIWKLIDKLDSLSSSAVINLPIQIKKVSMQSQVYDILLHIEVRQNTFIPNDETKAILQEIKAQSRY